MASAGGENSLPNMRLTTGLAPAFSASLHPPAAGPQAPHSAYTFNPSWKELFAKLLREALAPRHRRVYPTSLLQYHEVPAMAAVGPGRITPSMRLQFQSTSKLQVPSSQYFNAWDASKGIRPSPLAASLRTGKVCSGLSLSKKVAA
jgi:hypothetical protein